MLNLRLYRRFDGAVVADCALVEGVLKGVSWHGLFSVGEKLVVASTWDHAASVAFRCRGMNHVSPSLAVLDRQIDHGSDCYAVSLCHLAISDQWVDFVDAWNRSGLFSQVSAERLALSGLRLPCPVAACCLRELHLSSSPKKCYESCDSAGPRGSGDSPHARTGSGKNLVALAEVLRQPKHVVGEVIGEDEAIRLLVPHDANRLDFLQSFHDLQRLRVPTVLNGLGEFGSNGDGFGVKSARIDPATIKRWIPAFP